MRTHQRVIGYRYSEFKINNADRIRQKNVMQEHPVIRAELKHIRSKIQKGDSE